MGRDPLLICEWTDEITATKGYFVLDKIASGLCAGGIRMRPGATLDESARLARTMTYKLAAIDIPIGGAKGAIDYDPQAPESNAILRRYLAAFKPFVLDSWLTNEDLGTKDEDIVAALGELGVPSTFQAIVLKSPNPDRVVDKIRRYNQLRIDGRRMADVITGFGVAEVTLEAMQLKRMPLNDTRVAIQGFGSVGGSAARYLSQAGLSIVAVADAMGTIYSPAGLDVDLLLTLRDRWGVIDTTSLPDNCFKLRRDDWLSLNVDVLIPAAVPEAINEENVEVINASLIVEAANIPTTAGAEERLFERDITLVPDYIANSGAVGLATSILLERVEPEVAECLSFISRRLRSTVRDVFDLSQKEELTLRQAADRIAEEKSTADLSAAVN